MGKPKKMKILIGILKDKLSIIKATLLLPSATPYYLPILKGTTHHPLEAPLTIPFSETSTNNHHQTTALLDALLRRLQRTNSSHVALKCLIIYHNIIIINKHQQQIHHGSHQHHHLNLSNFIDGSDRDTLELSKWVRWYADVLHQNLVLSRTLGFHFYPSNGQISRGLTPRLLRELNSLVSMMEQICNSPESLHYQRIDLIYEVMKLVGEDYRITLRGINERISEFSQRIDELREEELVELLNDLKRLEDCKEKAWLMFLNKKRNDGAWESIAELSNDVEKIMERTERVRIVKFENGGEFTVPRGKKWLDVDWNSPLVVPLSCR